MHSDRRAASTSCVSLTRRRLIPLDTLFAVGDRIGKGAGETKALANLQSQMARFEDAQSVAQLAEFGGTKPAVSLGYWSERHIEQERKINLDAVVKSADKKDARAALTPFLRDTLVGFLYAYYAPPGAQLLLANPLFVRNHDFIGAQGYGRRHGARQKSWERAGRPARADD